MRSGSLLVGINLRTRGLNHRQEHAILGLFESKGVTLMSAVNGLTPSQLN
ncbi:hypothetical protein LZ22198_MCBDPFMK_01943 [Levilactobacillus zymae]